MVVVMAVAVVRTPTTSTTGHRNWLAAFYKQERVPPVGILRRSVLRGAKYQTMVCANDNL